jgi:hypothetical protein
MPSQRPFTMIGSVIAAGALAACLATAGCVVQTPPPHVVTAEVVEEPVDFETSLAPHGAWLVTSTCGRVWRPHAHVVGDGFMPYHSGGEWVYTDYGWSFETDWEWGWAVYHYGRWCPDPGEGWVWVPGTVWAPAWVEWRTGGGYIGWAPLLPPTVVVTHTHVHWVFVEAQHFHGGHHVHHAVPPERRREIYETAQPVHKVVKHESASWSHGPDADELSRTTGKEVRRVRVEPSPPPKPGTIRRATARPIKKTPPAVRPEPAGKPRSEPAPRPHKR